MSRTGKSLMPRLFGAAFLILLPAGVAAGAPISADAINDAQFSARTDKGLNAVTLKAEVLLARAGYSPGVIDGRDGENFHKALRAYQAQQGLEAHGKLDEATWNKLTSAATAPVVVDYKIREADLKGPFVKRIPKDFEHMARLDRLAYRSPRELLAEKFHMDEALLVALNKGKALNRVDTASRVANVGPDDQNNATGRASEPNTGSKGRDAERKGANRNNKPDVKVEIDKAERAVRVFAGDGGLLAYYPASIGSSEKPAPSGSFAVRAVTRDPTYRYDPKYAFKGQKAKEPVEVAPGPNNPVGSVWIALSVDSYGIHGTPEPDKVGKTYSHGCIRLTNWDALALANLVKKGTPVEFKE